MERLAERLFSWASILDELTRNQAHKTALMPFIFPHVALMPDAHLGKGATVGSVIPTQGAIVPAAVGVDIGCGMIATETDLAASDLPESLRALMPLIEARIPAGVGKGHDEVVGGAAAVLAELGTPHTVLNAKQTRTVAEQFGT